MIPYLKTSRSHPHLSLPAPLFTHSPALSHPLSFVILDGLQFSLYLESEYAQTYVFPKLKELVEETYLKNGNSSVILISHSMGCPYTLYFLNHLSQEWKDKYVKSWMPISGPFGGSMRIVQLYASGYSLGLPDIVLEPLNLRPAQRSFASSAYLFPSREFWKDDEVGLLAAAT